VLTDRHLAAPDLSIVLCTYNRSRLLDCALRALEQQTLDPARLEIIVIDNNSTDDTAAVTRRHLDRYPHIQYVFEAVQGLPFARNAGVAAARAPIVAFTDDDVEVAPEWAAAILKVFENPDVGYIGGKVLPVWAGAPRPAWVPETHYGPLALQDRGNRPFSVGAHDARACLIGANFAVRRCVFEAVGGFSPAFPWGEDREFQLRAWDRGVRGRYVPDVVAICRVPVDRLTKQYQRRWFAHAGRVHARMRLLERMDREGRLVPAVRGATLFGVRRFLLTQLVADAARWLAAICSLDTARAFSAQMRVLYLTNYVVQRRRSERPGGADCPVVAVSNETAVIAPSVNGSASVNSHQQSTV
jgi:glycosyltransferase involved in cell wall biosynthesis